MWRFVDRLDDRIDRAVRADLYLAKASLEMLEQRLLRDDTTALDIDSAQLLISEHRNQQVAFPLGKHRAAIKRDTAWAD
jgi:hypothetical protein